MTHGTSWGTSWGTTSLLVLLPSLSPFLFSVRTPVTLYIYIRWPLTTKLKTSGHRIYIFGDRLIHFCKTSSKRGWGNLRGVPRVWIKGVTHPLARHPRHPLLANFYEKSKLPREKWMGLWESGTHSEEKYAIFIENGPKMTEIHHFKHLGIRKVENRRKIDPISKQWISVNFNSFLMRISLSNRKLLGFLEKQC